MQIKFEATKLKEANQYVDLLNGKVEEKKIKERKKTSLLKRVFGFLFR